MQTNRLTKAQDFTSNNLGMISQQPTDAENAASLALQTATNVVSPELTTQPVLQSTPQQNIQQSQAPSVNPVDLATQTAQNIVTNEPVRQKFVWQDVIKWLQEDINAGMPLEALQEYYPEITPDIWVQLYDDIKAWMPLEAVAEYYPELTLSSQVDNKDIQIGWVRATSRQWEWIIPAKSERYSNPFGAMFETVDNLTQQIPQFSPDSSWLESKLNSLQQSEIDKYREKYKNSPTIQKLYWSETNYIKEQQKSFIDTLFGVWDKWPNVPTMLANIPASAAKTLTAIARASTNPYDALKWFWMSIMQAVQWQWPLIERYGSIDNFRNTLEQDPIGVASDVLSIVEPVGKLSGKWLTRVWMAEQWARLSNIWEIAGKASTLWVPNVVWGALDKLQSATAWNKILWWAVEWLVFPTRPLEEVGKGISKLATAAQTSAIDKLLPENLINRRDIVNNPFTYDYFNSYQEQFNNNPDLTVKDFSEWVIDDYVTSLTERRNAEVETKYQASPAYQMLKEDKVKHSYAPLQDTFLALADKYNIWVELVDWKPKLDFTDTSLKEWEQAKINKAVEKLFSSNEKDTASLMNNRQAISDDIKYDTGDPFVKGQSQFMRELRDNIDSYAKNAIPYFWELTALYEWQIKKLKEWQWVFFNKDWTIKKSLYNDLLNIDLPSKRDFKEKVTAIDPSLPARIKWLKLLKDIETLKTSDKWLWWVARLFDAIWWALWYSFFGTFLGWILWYATAKTIEWFPLQMLKNLRYNEVLKLMSSVSDEQASLLQEIAVKKMENQALSKNDKLRVQLLIQNIWEKVKAIKNEQKETAALKWQLFPENAPSWLPLKEQQVIQQEANPPIPNTEALQSLLDKERRAKAPEVLKTNTKGRNKEVYDTNLLQRMN